MNTKLIEAKNSEELIVFLSGWGCDDNQFAKMASSRNILICWDYTNLEYEFDFSKYKSVDLIAYSAGVFTAGLLKSKLPKFRKKIAINGNPLMFDKHFGIPSKIIEIFKNLNIDNYMDFRRQYLVFNEDELKSLDASPCLRTFESCREEIDKLEVYSQGNYPLMNFDLAILSDSDKIFNPDTQREYFEGRYIILKKQAHNVFSILKSYDDILNKLSK